MTATEVFYNLISEVTFHHFCFLLLATQTNSGILSEGTMQGSEYQEAGIIEIHLGSHHTDFGNVKAFKPLTYNLQQWF